MKLYGNMTNEELNIWERSPVAINILSSREFGAWLQRRDENKAKQNIGHWAQTDRIFMDAANQHVYEQICSKCKGLSYFRKSSGKLIGADCCPNCGAVMRGSD